MASTMVKSTGKALKKSAQVKAVSKAAKGTRKTVTKAVKGWAITKTAQKALSRTSARTRAGIALGAGATTAVIFSRRRRSKRGSTPTTELNDPALARKVESEIFRPADAPKGQVSVSVEHRVAILRGTVRDEAQAKELERTAAAVDGIERVENLLHRPGEPAPAKSESHENVERPVES
jgi:osmotically-inducible protein OsmY